MDPDIDAGKMVSMIRDKYCEGSNIKFAEAMGESKTTVSNWCNAKSLGKQVLVKLLLKFEKLDANWLLLGRGEMEKQPSEIVSEENLNDTDMDKTIIETFGNLNEQIRDLKAKVNKLESEKAELLRKLGIEESAGA